MTPYTLWSELYQCEYTPRLFRRTVQPLAVIAALSAASQQAETFALDVVRDQDVIEVGQARRVSDYYRGYRDALAAVVVGMSA